MSAAVIPIHRPQTQADREWHAWAAEMRHLYPDAILVTPQEALGYAQAAARVKDELWTEVDAYHFAKDLFG